MVQCIIMECITCSFKPK